MRVEESVEIARRPQQVWDYVSDPSNDLHWCKKAALKEALEPR